MPSPNPPDDEEDGAVYNQSFVGLWITAISQHIYAADLTFSGGAGNQPNEFLNAAMTDLDVLWSDLTDAVRADVWNEKDAKGNVILPSQALYKRVLDYDNNSIQHVVGINDSLVNNQFSGMNKTTKAAITAQRIETIAQDFWFTDRYGVGKPFKTRILNMLQDKGLLLTAGNNLIGRSTLPSMKEWMSRDKKAKV